MEIRKGLHFALTAKVPACRKTLRIMPGSVGSMNEGEQACDALRELPDPTGRTARRCWMLFGSEEFQKKLNPARAAFGYVRRAAALDRSKDAE
jgi:hypothetical protein